MALRKIRKAEAAGRELVKAEQALETATHSFAVSSALYGEAAGEAADRAEALRSRADDLDVEAVNLAHVGRLLGAKASLLNLAGD